MKLSTRTTLLAAILAAALTAQVLIYPPEYDGPALEIFPDCSVKINRHVLSIETVEEAFTELVRLIATGKPLCGPKPIRCGVRRPNQ